MSGTLEAMEENSSRRRQMGNASGRVGICYCKYRCQGRPHDKVHLSRELKGMNKQAMQNIVSRIFQAKETAGAKEAGMCLVCSGNSIKVRVPGGE